LIELALVTLEGGHVLLRLDIEDLHLAIQANDSDDEYRKE